MVRSAAITPAFEPAPESPSAGYVAGELKSGTKDLFPTGRFPRLIP